MSKKMRKVCAAVVMMGILTGSITGCSGNSKQTASGNNTAKETETKGEGGSKQAGGEERVTISIMGPLFGEAPDPDHIVRTMLEEELNINLEEIWVPGNNYEEKLSVTIASKDMPDLIAWTKLPDPLLNKYAKQGAFTELSELVKDYPNIIKVPQDIWDNLKIDGKLYGIPRYRNPEKQASFIRKDWLDNLGLEIPKTTDELFEVALQFTKNDPDQNGKDDTFGICIGENLSNLDILNIAMGTGNTWQLKEDQTVQMSYTTEEQKQVLQFLADLYKEGAIDKDFSMLKNTQVWEKFEGGKGGILVFGQTSDYRRYVQNLEKIDPKGEIIMIEPIAGPTGISGTVKELGTFGQLVIPSDREPEKVARILETVDYMMSDEGYNLGKYGIEGVHHTVEADGTRVKTQAYTDEKVKDFMANAVDEMMYASAPEPEIRIKQEENLKMMKGRGIPNPVGAYVTPTQVSKQADLDKMKNEYFTKIVMGELQVEAFDEFVSKWLAAGGEQITKEMNEYYQTIK